MLPLRYGSLATTWSDASEGEQFETLCSGSGVRIERIASRGHRSPDGFWYDQQEHEFVHLVSGAAELEFEDGSIRRLEAGDWLEIPAHVRHRVKWTQPGMVTLWLAVFYGND